MKQQFAVVAQHHLIIQSCSTLYQIRLNGFIIQLVIQQHLMLRDTTPGLDIPDLSSNKKSVGASVLGVNRQRYIS